MGYNYCYYFKLKYSLNFKINSSKPSIMNYKNTHKRSLASINYLIDYLV